MNPSRRPLPLGQVRAPSLAACLCAALPAGCDESFEPLAPSDLAFSVFGYLDASADTQWIRVMPLRPLRVAPPDPLHATVTLEHLGTGRIIELRDPLFRFSSLSDPAIGSEGMYVHNFWTQEQIEPGATYRFLATRAGEEPAEAVVAIPRDYDVEVEIKQPSAPLRETDHLRITSLKHLPFLTAVTYFYDDCGPNTSAVRYEGRSADDGAYLIAIAPALVTPRNQCGDPLVEKRELRLVGSELAWQRPTRETSAAPRLTRPTPTPCTRPRTNGCARRSGSTAEARGARSGNPPTGARRGVS